MNLIRENGIEEMNNVNNVKARVAVVASRKSEQWWGQAAGHGHRAHPKGSFWWKKRLHLWLHLYHLQNTWAIKHRGQQRPHPQNHVL